MLLGAVKKINISSPKTIIKIRAILISPFKLLNINITQSMNEKSYLSYLKIMTFK